MGRINTFIKLVWNDGDTEYEDDYGLDLDAARQDAIYFEQKRGATYVRIIEVNTNYCDYEDINIIYSWDKE